MHKAWNSTWGGLAFVAFPPMVLAMTGAVFGPPPRGFLSPSVFGLQAMMPGAVVADWLAIAPDHWSAAAIAVVLSAAVWIHAWYGFFTLDVLLRSTPRDETPPPGAVGW